MFFLFVFLSICRSKCNAYFGKCVQFHQKVSDNVFVDRHGTRQGVKDNLFFLRGLPTLHKPSAQKQHWCTYTQKNKGTINYWSWTVTSLLCVSCPRANKFSAILFLPFARSSSNSPRSFHRFRRIMRRNFNWIRQQVKNFPIDPHCKNCLPSATL